jgi:hypothetical protein
MNTYKEILFLIEAVDISDEIKLNEIDARIWCFLRPGVTFRCFTGSGSFYYRGARFPEKEPDYLMHCFSIPKFTRSRDALKPIRPVGWSFGIESINDQDVDGIFEAWIYNNLDEHFSDRLNSFQAKNEELAELHTIIQAIAYERGYK